MSVSNIVSAAASVAFTLAIVAGSSPAHASLTSSTTPQIAVHYTQADLVDPAARASLDHRIRTAATKVCRRSSETDSGAFAFMRCTSDAAADAERTLDTEIATR